MMKKSSRFFMATVKIGPKGQIVIPKEAREMFGVEPGDSLILLCDRKRGMALQTPDYLAPKLQKMAEEMDVLEDTEE